jgi:hypothetical protein
LSINGLGLGLSWTIENIYKKYDEDRREWKRIGAIGYGKKKNESYQNSVIFF